MQGLQIHLENLVNRAQCHMRRDELWKRMLYGRPKSEGRPSSVSMAPNLRAFSKGYNIFGWFFVIDPLPL